MAMAANMKLGLHGMLLQLIAAAVHMYAGCICVLPLQLQLYSTVADCCNCCRVAAF